jgi:hypothetical protein
MALLTTRSNLKSYAIAAIHGGAADTVAIARVERGIENALDMLARERCWSFHQDTYDVIATAMFDGGSAAGRASVAIGSTSVTITAGSNLPSDIVGQFIEFQGENHWYEITARGGDTSLTIRQAYSNESGTAITAQPYRIVYALYDLPLSFARLRPEGGGLFDVSNGDELEQDTFGALHLFQRDYVGAGVPWVFAIVPKRNDPSVRQLFLYPPPETAKRYQLVYFRKPGWFDTATPATSTWKAKATADTDYVDWPPKENYVLEAAVLAAVAREIKPASAPEYEQAFAACALKAASYDQVGGRAMRLSRGGSVRGKTRWVIG